MQEVFEIWKDVPGYEGFYQASNKGNVRSVDRYIECRGTMRMQKGKMLKPHIGKFGYKQVILYNKKPKLFKVHRLVAMAFIPNPENLPQVNHKDEDKTNNNVENLEWCTCLYNLTYNDLHHRRNNMNNKKSKQVMQIKDGKVIATYPSINEAARKLNCGSGNIVRCCKGEKKIAYGYQWKYVESYQPKGVRSMRDGIQSNDTRVEELSVIRILRELHEKSRKENDGKVHVREIKDGDIGRTIEKF